MKSSQNKDSLQQVSLAEAMKGGHKSAAKAGGFPPVQAKRNQTGLPDNLKAGLENLSGFSMNDVKVHYNSSQPATLQAHAYAQGTDIHVAPGQERHLPHEAWHVVQQKQGRVKPTRQLKGKTNINDDTGLEHEADVMGERAQRIPGSFAQWIPSSGSLAKDSVVTQRVINYGQATERIPVSDDEEMLEFLVGRLGEKHRQYLSDQLDIERGRKGRSISPHQFFQAILGVISSQVEQLAPSALNKPRMPEDFQQIKDFAVTEGTKLLGSVGASAIPLISNIKGGKHAESLFIESVEELEDIDLKDDPVITITINNSPCSDRCAKRLAAWVRENNLTQVTIYFANPHGFDESVEEDEFLRSRRMLREAGIQVKPFEPRNFISSAHRSRLSKGKGKGWNNRYDTMDKRRRRAQATGRFDSDDDDSAKRRSRSRSRTPKRRGGVASGAASATASGRRRESRSPLGPKEKESRRDKGRLRSESPAARRNMPPGTLRNVKGEGMDCLIRAVLMAVQGGVDEHTVGNIRQHLVDQHVALVGEMLDLAGDAGAVMIGYMIAQNILPANRGIVVYVPYGRAGVRRHVIIDGDNPINLWLEDEHFQAIV